MLIDLPLDELRTYRPNLSEPPDFDRFWQATLADVANHPLAATFEPVNDDIYAHVDVFDVTYAGFDGQPIRGWLLQPAGTPEPLPCVVSFVGYGGGRSLPIDHLAPVAAGFVHFVMDTRGQGSNWSPGNTPDDAGSGPHYPGFLTSGVESPQTYYYRRVYTDAVRAVEAACSWPQVDAECVAVAGASQGGGIALAVAGLVPTHVRALVADVPFLCHFRRATEITDNLPYAEIKSYLACHRDRVEDVFGTLAYFDGVHFAPRVQARSLFSVGLMDATCPPSTVFAAYNRVRADKGIQVFEFNEHEGGGPFALAQRLRFLKGYL